MAVATVTFRTIGVISLDEAACTVNVRRRLGRERRIGQYKHGGTGEYSAGQARTVDGVHPHACWASARRHLQRRSKPARAATNDQGCMRDRIVMSGGKRTCCTLAAVDTAANDVALPTDVHGKPLQSSGNAASPTHAMYATTSD